MAIITPIQNGDIPIPQGYIMAHHRLYSCCFCLFLFLKKHTVTYHMKLYILNPHDASWVDNPTKFTIAHISAATRVGPVDTALADLFGTNNKTMRGVNL
jgi:hypothetical protein